MFVVIGFSLLVKEFVDDKSKRVISVLEASRIAAKQIKSEIDISSYNVNQLELVKKIKLLSDKDCALVLGMVFLRLSMKREKNCKKKKI